MLSGSLLHCHCQVSCVPVVNLFPPLSAVVCFCFTLCSFGTLDGAQVALSWSAFAPRLLAALCSGKFEAWQCERGGDDLVANSTLSGTLQLLAECKDRVRIELSKQHGTASQVPGFTKDGDQPQQSQGALTEVLQDASMSFLHLPLCLSMHRCPSRFVPAWVCVIVCGCA